METKPEPAVGQLWRERSGRDPYRITRVIDGRFALSFRGGDDDGPTYLAEAIKLDEFVGYAPGFGPTESGKSGEGRPVDWAKWLPPQKLPDRSPLARKAGQVWAWRDENSDPIVYRMPPGNCMGSVPVEVLSRPKFNGHGCNMDGGGHGSTGGCAILVADVGCEPTPPEVLYGPPQAPVAGPPAKALEVGCNTPGPVASPAPVRGERWNIGPTPYSRLIGEMRASDGTPLTALQAIKAKRMEPAPPVEPFVPSIDDDFWIPDAPRGLVTK